jgi:hypothetical protein
MECRGRSDGSVHQRKRWLVGGPISRKVPLRADGRSAKQKLYKMLTGAGELKPKNITASSCLTST